MNIAPIDPIIASLHEVNPQTIKSALAYKDSLSKINNQLQLIWKGHKKLVDNMSLSNDQFWKKKDWRRWKSTTFTIWKKQCWNHLTIIKGIQSSSVEAPAKRGEFINCLKKQSLQIDSTSAFANKLEEIVTAMFEKDNEQGKKAKTTRDATQKRAREAAELEQKFQLQQDEKKKELGEKKAKIETFAKETGMTPEQAAFINSFMPQKK